MQRKLKIDGELVAQSAEGHLFVVKTDEQNIVLSFQDWDSVMALVRTQKIKLKRTRRMLRYGKNLSQTIIFVVSGKVLFEVSNGKISKTKLRETFKLYYNYWKKRRKQKKK